MSNQLTIVAVEYLETEYEETRKCIEATGLPVIFVPRNPAGIGSLSEAINRGMLQVQSKYAWIITNITFNPKVPGRLLNHIGDAWAIHPQFASDHIHLREGEGVAKIPFCEFTAAMVNVSKWIPLDENMPYWGHDLDWGYRVHKRGGSILCDHTTGIGHTYIRNSQTHPIREARKLQRKITDSYTRVALQNKYGANWRDIVWPKTDREIGAFYEQVKQKCFT